MSKVTGSGLNIIIECEYCTHHNWMAFASWYSISKNLPDAVTQIYCTRKTSNIPLFKWPGKVGAKFGYGQIAPHGRQKMEEGGFILITPDVLAVRQWDEKGHVVDAASEEMSTFVSYLNGCGKFVMDSWINKIEPPFAKVNSFKKNGMTTNEARVLELWSKLLPVYTMVVG